MGAYGLRAFSGYVREEFLPQLMGRQAQRVYREMLDNSSVVGSVLFAVTQAMRRVSWRVESANDSTEAKAYAEFVGSLMDDMSTPWEDFVSESLSMLGYGFSVHEIVYKRRLGRRPDSRPGPKSRDMASSKFIDGKIGWRRLPIRAQDTILKWFFDPNGGVQGLTQQPYAGPTIDIPIEKLLLFRAGVHKNNPEGRPCTLDTKVPTPDGWTTMGAIKPGDRVYDETGAIRRVVGKSEVFKNRPVYEIEFATGATVRADACHLWRVTDTNDRTHGKTRDVTTEQIAAWFEADGDACRKPGPSADRWFHRKAKNISCGIAPVLEGEDRALPLDPYVFGYWLGNGNSKAAQLTCHAEDAEEIASLISGAGFATEIKNDWQNAGAVRHIGFYGSQKWATDNAVNALRFMGVYDNKHVPAAYLTAPPVQRLALLQGLMDSDGWSPAAGTNDRASTFANTNEALISAVVELVRSLGGQPRVRTIDRVGDVGGVVNGRPVVSKAECYEVRFILDMPVHRLSRKAVRQQKKRTHRIAGHFIKAIRRVENADTVCIEVDSPSHLFLVGDAMIPTHNSILRNGYRPFYFIKRLEELEAIGVERFNGLPKVSVPNELIERALALAPDGSQADPAAAAAYAAYKKLATNIRIDEQMGIVLPSDVWKSDDGKPGTARMFDIELATPQHGAGKSGDTDKIINRYKVDIMTTVLADFIQMGHEVRGTNNLAVTKVDMFYQAIEGWLNGQAAVLNRHGLPRLWKLNGDDLDLMPQFVPDMAQRLDLDSLGAYVANLSAAGMPMFPDEPLQKFLREAGGMPENTDPAAMAAARATMEAALSSATNKNPPKVKTSAKGKKPKTDNSGADA